MYFLVILSKEIFLCNIIMKKNLRAISITHGENAENHFGMQLVGNSELSDGYSTKDLKSIKKKFKKMGGKAKLIKLNKYLPSNVQAEEASVLILRNGIDVLLNNWISKNIKSKLGNNHLGSKLESILKKELNSRKLFEEQINLDWDTKYYDVRRSKVLNKRARYNICYGSKSQKPDYKNKKGTVIKFDSIPIFKIWRSEILDLCNEDETFVAEGNYYYDVKKCGIGYHGDGERRKVVAGNLSDESVVRELHWQAYYKNKKLGQVKQVKLNSGDMYIMNVKATGNDWKKKNLITWRHAAGIENSKYLESK